MSKFIKKHKKILILGLIFVLILLVIVLMGSSGPKTKPSTPPLIIINPKTENTFMFVSADPPSGPRQTPDSLEPISFLFSEPIDEKSVSVKVTPFVKVRTKVFEGAPDKLWVEPDGSFWKDNVEYKITISSSLKSVSGNKLNGEVQYTLYKTTPKFINAGDLNQK